MFLVALIILLICASYLYLTKSFSYWKNKGVIQKYPIPIFGNCKKIILLQKWMGTALKELYDEFPKEPFIGIYLSSNPVLLVRDPDLMKQIFVKDFYHFQDREHIKENQTQNDPLHQSLLHLSGEKWKHLRNRLTPTFSSGKLKAMYNLIEECGKDLQIYLTTLANSGESIEMRDLSSKYTTQVIGSIAFGIETNAINDPNSIFYRMGQKLFEPDPLRMLKFLIRWFLPQLGAFISLKATPVSVDEFFIGIVKEVIAYRKINNIKRDDFMQLLIKLQEDDNDSRFRFDDKILAAQAFIFFTAGFETSSATMSFILYELSLHQEIQARVQSEIDQVLSKYEGVLTYEGIHELTYLEQIFYEALRMYPPIGSLIRLCTIPYIIPGSNVHIPAGRLVQFPVYALHHDPIYYPDPYKFNPDRFSEENNKTRHPFTFLPFGEGPRNCIGMRFAKLQTMAGVASILSKFSFTPSQKTDIPLKFSSKSFILKTENGIWLDVKPRHPR